VTVLVDVLRATSSLVTLFDRGCSGVIPVGSLVAARRLARTHGYILAGERNGLTPAGFRWNNSPAALAQADFAGEEVVLTTSNGTAALRWLRNAPAVLAGSLLNGPACAERAVAVAGQQDGDVGIACAGRGRRFALDDAICAGYLVEMALGAYAPELKMTDAARAARQLWLSNREDIAGAFRLSGSGQRLAEIGLDEDVLFCARTAVSEAVPELRRGSPDRFVRASE
jgi:2-phosphosulfolactate phosphatase